MRKDRYNCLLNKNSHCLLLAKRVQLVILVLLIEVGISNVLIVPTNYPNIQAGVDAAIDGDTVLVLNGIYSGEGNYDIEIFHDDMALTLISESGPDSCIIDCQQAGRGMLVVGYNLRVEITGFTIMNGNAEAGGGLGIGPVGGNNGYAEFNNLIIVDNRATYGGGISYGFAYPVFNNCLIMSNTATDWGDGIYQTFSGSSSLFNCMIMDMVNIDAGGPINAFYCLLSPDLQFYDFNQYDSIIDFPLFEDEENHNFHLLPQSPCINAGDPSFPLDPDGSPNDIGPLYFRIENGDLNFDNEVNVIDIIVCVNIILDNVYPYNAQFWAADLNLDNEINVLDVLLIVDIIIEN